MPAVIEEAQDRNARELVSGIFIADIKREMLSKIALLDTRVPVKVGALRLQNLPRERSDIDASELHLKPQHEQLKSIARTA